MSQISSDKGTYPSNIQRRITELLARENSLGTPDFTISGDIALILSSTPVSLKNSEGIFTRISHTVQASVEGDLMYVRQKEPSFYSRFKLPSSTSVRMFIGMTNQLPGQMTGNPTLPSGHYAGLYYNSALGTNWRFVHAGGGGATISVQNAVETINPHHFYLWMKKAGGQNNIIFQYDDNDRYEASINIPGIVTPLRYVLAIGIISGTKQLDIAKMVINSEV